MRVLANAVNPVDENGRLRWASLTALYIFCNILHAGSWNSKYWDEWLFYVDIPRLRQLESSCSISRCKLPFTFLWEQPLLQLGRWALRLLVIVALFSAGVFVSRILDEIPQLGQWERSVTTVLFLLIPIN